jgi:centromere protein I
MLSGAVLMLIFLDLYSSTFQPLEWAILDDTPASQMDLLTFYTSIIRNWTSSLLSKTPPAFTGATINALTTHVNVLALTILQTGPFQSTVTHHSVLYFYEATASLLSQPSLQSHVRITTPPSALIYTLHFAPSLSTFSRLCDILALYKRAFETAMSKPIPARADPSQAAPETYPKEYVNHFNGFLMDICNCLWRSRAFNTTDTNALGCLLPPPLLPKYTSYVSSLDTGLALPSLFTLSYSPVLCNLSISYLRGLEDKAEEETEGGIKIRHAGPVTQKSLVALGKEGGLQLSWAEYRLGVLTYLEQKGVKGVGELMYNTMKHLMTAREAAGKI